MDEIKALKDKYGWSVREIGRRTGRDQRDLSELVRIAEHPEVAEERITPTAVGPLVEARNHALREPLIAAIRAGTLRTGAEIEGALEVARGAGTNLPGGRGVGRLHRAAGACGAAGAVVRPGEDDTDATGAREPAARAGRAAFPTGYGALLGDLKERIRSAQIRAALAVNQELVLLYWQIGRSIRERQEAHGWGTQVIDRLSADLRRAFPEMKGFSPRNLRYMRAFAASYPDPDFLQQVAAKLPWGHHMLLLDAVPDAREREWYARQAIEELEASLSEETNA